MNLALALLAITLVGGIWLVGVCVRQKLVTRRPLLPDRHALIIVPQRRILIVHRDPSLIPIPDHLKAHAEMGAWMTRDPVREPDGR